MPTFKEQIDQEDTYKADQSPLYQLSPMQLQDLSEQSKEDPSLLTRLSKLWDKTKEGFDNAYAQAVKTPAAVSEGISKAGERVAEAPAKIATRAKTVAGEVGKGTAQAASQALEVPSKVINAVPKTAEAVHAGLSKAGGEPLPKAKEAPAAEQTPAVVSEAPEELQEQTKEDLKAISEQIKDPAQADDVKTQIEDKFAGLSVAPKVYSAYTETLDGALKDYHNEVGNVRKAQLFSAIAEALAMLFVAHTTKGYAGGAETLKFDKHDWDSRLTQAARTLDATRGIEREKLASQREQVADKRSIYNLEQEDLKGSEIKAARAERDETRKEDKATREATRLSEKEQKDAGAEANRLTKRKDDLVKGVNKILDSKLDTDEKTSRIEALVTNSGLPLSPEAKAKLGRKARFWQGLEKESRQDDLNFILDTEINPKIEDIRTGRKADTQTAEPTKPTAQAKPKKSEDPNMVTLYNPKTGESGDIDKNTFNTNKKKFIEGGYEVVN